MTSSVSLGGTPHQETHRSPPVTPHPKGPLVLHVDRNGKESWWGGSGPSCSGWCHGNGVCETMSKVVDCMTKIRPHRFGGEGVLIGGQNSNTKCSMTFVNIAVAISALAGGAQKRFRTETRIRWCFRHFSRIFGCLSARGYWNGILGHFGSFPAMEKRPKMKKNIVHSKILQGFWMPEHWKHCKNKCFGLTL